MIVRIESKQVPERKAIRMAKVIKSEGYWRSIEANRLQSVPRIMKSNKGVIL